MTTHGLVVRTSWYFLIYRNAVIWHVSFVSSLLFSDVTFSRFSTLLRELGCSFWPLCSVPLCERTQRPRPGPPALRCALFRTFAVQSTCVVSHLCTGMGPSEMELLDGLVLRSAWLVTVTLVLKAGGPPEFHQHFHSIGGLSCCFGVLSSHVYDIVLF